MAGVVAWERNSCSRKRASAIVLMHNHPSGETQPSEADIGIASTLGNSSVGFYIVDNTCSRIYAVVSKAVVSK